MVRMSRVAVVTGANQGLGFALAEGLAQRMAADGIVYLTGRSGDRLRDAATRLTAPVADVHTHVLDVRDGAAVAAFADELRDRHGGVNIVFSNAAARLTPEAPWSELPTIGISSFTQRPASAISRFASLRATANGSRDLEREAAVQGSPHAP